ncbi:hypothetical protein [Calditerricola satsumensis]|uniref:Uncharacterized protein n=1 Tax=Calditerricola satsumensis TaxID=373054 RepID=A0A8J3FAW4_9BACI|nr:hypothetical protein [Calditerricola satsumensis]GGJ98905.1 hypothetical protein GCM10007043_11120 [Calditerricola satsumensis]
MNRLGVVVLGIAVFGSFFFLSSVLALVSESMQGVVRGSLHLMYEPVRPLFERFSLPDDDPRILYPILLSSALWGILGGAASALAAFFAQRERKRLAVAAMGLGMALFIAGALLIGNVAQKSVIYRTWMWGGTAILVLLVAAVAVSWTAAVRSPWKAVGLSVLIPLVCFSVLFSIAQTFPTLYEPDGTGWDDYSAAASVLLGGLSALALTPVFTVAAALVQKRLRRG